MMACDVIGTSNMTSTVALQETWIAFCKEQNMQGGIFAVRDEAFSLMIGAVGEKFSEVCKAYGFLETQFDQLHMLLVELEQQCLLSLFIAFQNYRVRSSTEERQQNCIASNEEMHAVDKEECIPFSSNTRELIPDTHTDTSKCIRSSTKKIKGRSKRKIIPDSTTCSSAVKQLRVSPLKRNIPTLIDEKDIVNPETAASRDSELGRGKRKKFAKMQFDVLELENRQSSKIASRKRLKRIGDEKMTQVINQEVVKEKAVSDKTVCETPKLPGLSEENETSEKEKVAESWPGDDEREIALLGGSSYGTEVETFSVNKCIESDPDKGNAMVSKANSFEMQSKQSPSVDSDNCKEDNLIDSDNDKPKIYDKIKLDTKPKSSEMLGERTDFECDSLAPITCSMCKKKFPKSRDLIKHWKTIHELTLGKPSTPFYCDVCHESFDAPRRFKLHYRIHSGARPHICQVCGKTFRIFKGLTDHMLCHTKEKRFACPQCPKRFVIKKLLTHHIKVHNNEIVPRICELCGKQYQTSLGLKLHYRVHAGVRPHKCDVCGMAFTQRCSLQIHKRLHTGDKRHICDVCGWRFNTNNALVTHKRVHTGERPYKCSQCSFQAASSSCLRDHEKVHTTAKPFQCHALGCNKYFKRQAHLVTHLKKKHPGLKPYVCSLCGAKFAMVSELQLHQKSDACDGGRIVREATPEPEPLHDPVQTSFERYPSIPLPYDQIQNHSIAIFENQDDFSGIENPQIFARKQSEVLDSQSQELQIAYVLDVPNTEKTNEKNQIVIHIKSEPGAENSNVILSEEEMAAIVRLSQQM